MKTKNLFGFWISTAVALLAAPVDEKTSHGPLSLGQGIETLEQAKLVNEGRTVRRTKDGKSIIIENYKYKTSGLSFGDLPVSSARLDVIEHIIVQIYLLLDSDIMEEVQRQNPSDFSAALKKRGDESSAKRRLLSLAMIEKYGAPVKPRASSSSEEPTSFFWEGEDVALSFYLTSKF
jgi:hypothetical protein